MSLFNFETYGMYFADSNKRLPPCYMKIESFTCRIAAQRILQLSAMNGGHSVAQTRLNQTHNVSVSNVQYPWPHDSPRHFRHLK